MSDVTPHNLAPSASRCCGAPLVGTLADGILAGSCASCGAWERRLDPATARYQLIAPGGNPWVGPFEWPPIDPLRRDPT